MMCYVTLSHNIVLSSIQAAGLCMQVTASLVISSFVSFALRPPRPPSHGRCLVLRIVGVYFGWWWMGL
jgi:hypothetical protein